MNADECREAAQKLIHALKNNTNDAYNKWLQLKGKGQDEHAKFIQETAGLSQTPTADDMQQMYTQSQSALKSDVAAMHSQQGAEHVVGFACVADDE